jgi:hypothetical protein
VSILRSLCYSFAAWNKGKEEGKKGGREEEEREGGGANLAGSLLLILDQKRHCFIDQYPE